MRGDCIFRPSCVVLTKALIWCHLDKHILEIITGASIAFTLKILAAAFAFAMNIILARVLGPEGFGIYSLALSIVMIVSAISRVGMENVLIKLIAINVKEDKLGKVLGIYQKVMLYTLSTAIILSGSLFLLTPWISQVYFTKPKLEQPLSIMAVAVIPLTLFTLHAYALQGIKKIAASTLVLSLITPFVICVTTILFIPRYSINATAWVYLFATIVTLLFGRWFWQKTTCSFKTHTATFNTSELLSCCIPFFGIVMMNMIIDWSPLLFLGRLEGFENIGFYNVANRTTTLMSFILIAVNSISAPKFAALYQQGELEKLKFVAKDSTKIIFLFAVPISLIFILFPEWIMSLFGEQFKQGAQVLVILTAGQFFYVSTGLAGYLLIMSGYERLVFINLVGSALLLMLLNLWLIPSYGFLGSAIATSVASSVRNIIALTIVWKKMGIMLFPNIRSA